MKKMLVYLLIIIALFLVGCGNNQIIDTKWTFSKAIIEIGDQLIEVEVKSWKDYEGDSVQVVCKNGTVYLTSYKNVLLINE